MEACTRSHAVRMHASAAGQEAPDASTADMPAAVGASLCANAHAGTGPHGESPDSSPSGGAPAQIAQTRPDPPGPARTRPAARRPAALSNAAAAHGRATGWSQADRAEGADAQSQAVRVAAPEPMNADPESCPRRPY